ncbi:MULTISPECIES: hypothetical protein [Stenotrophomonas]|uniref:hypothetical protein n=1 Tax=Stenotrophomonas TaxID=40323 RepID=UPI0032EE3580
MATAITRITGRASASTLDSGDLVRITVNDQAIAYLVADEAERLAIELQRAAQQLRMARVTADNYTRALLGKVAA